MGQVIAGGGVCLTPGRGEGTKPLDAKTRCWGTRHFAAHIIFLAHTW